MWVAKESELIGSSAEGFEAAAGSVVERAHRTLRGITGIEVLAKSVAVEEGRLEYRVRLRLSFDVAPGAVLHW
jgi:flavin-binding protein dodecin